MAQRLQKCCKDWQPVIRRSVSRALPQTSRQLHSSSATFLTRIRTPNVNSRNPTRSFHTATHFLRSRRDAPTEPPPTDFNELNMLGDMPAPSTSVDVCMYDGFGLNSGLTITGGNGALLLNGEAFAWRPWEAKESMELVNKKGQFELPSEAFGVFDLLWPRPDLLVIGVGKQNVPLSPETRKHIAELGMRVEVLDTRNAAAQFNLLATERGVSEVAAALIPMGWKDGVGVEA